MTLVEASSYEVDKYDGEAANGVSDVVTILLGQNFANYPKRVRIGWRISRPVTIYSTDTESACTIIFGADKAVVYNDVVGDPIVTVMATVNQILDVSQLKMRAGGLLPVGFFTKRGMGVLGAILARKLVVKGLVTHPITALRVIALVSVVES